MSLASGRAVAEALRRGGHAVFEADIGPENLVALDRPADVVFPALHGDFGEDGKLQRILEQRGIRFVGSGSQTSALAMDKVATKQRVAQMGIPTPPWEVWTTGTSDGGESVSAQPNCGTAVLGCAKRNTAEGGRATSGPRVGFPLIVKPVDQGSSVGTFIIRKPEQFDAAVREVTGEFGRALVERFIEGDELTVGMLGEQSLPPICIRPRRDFYDYTAKYEDDATEYLFDAGQSRDLLEQASAYSRRIFGELGCRHLGRIDWMVDRGGGLWFLEVNTIPGFTSHSLVPKAADRIGIDFAELVERLVLMAVTDTP